MYAIQAQEGKLEQEKADLIAQINAMQGQKVVVQEERDNLKHNKENLSTEVMQLQVHLSPLLFLYIIIDIYSIYCLQYYIVIYRVNWMFNRLNYAILKLRLTPFQKN